MTTLYKRYDVTTIAEVNALALTDNQENGALVLGPYSETCSWSRPYATRNEPTETGTWSYEDGYGGDHLRDGDKVTVLVPIEAEEETRVTRETLALASARDSCIRTEAARDALDGMTAWFQAEADKCGIGGHYRDAYESTIDMIRIYRNWFHTNNPEA